MKNINEKSYISHKSTPFAMSLRIIIKAHIDKLFSDNTELEAVNKNRFEIAVSHFFNLSVLHGLDTDDLIDGIIGDGGDEGIDLCYLFHNGDLIKEEPNNINSESSFKLKIFQVKEEDSFKPTEFVKTKEGIEEIFNLDLPLARLKTIGANDQLLDKAELIRNVFIQSQKERASFCVEVFYVTMAPNIDIPEKIHEYEKTLEKNQLSIPFKFYYYGGQKLIDLNKNHVETLDIKFSVNTLEVFETGIDTKGYAGFVNGNLLMESLIDEDGFKSRLTDGNIRFFLGKDKEVNKSIISSALNKEQANIFWAMNNGVTIIGNSVVPLGSLTFSVKSPQIVNGCQTIHCLYDAYIQSGKKLPDSLKVFVKLVNTDNQNVQTDIINATNSQNSVKSASLKANDDIQRNIELHLKKHDIFYERRENYYKYQKKSGTKVIGLTKMAQIIHTVVNKESILAVNDTTKLFEKDRYNRIFHEKVDYDLYYFSVRLFQTIWKLKNIDIRNNNYESDKKELVSKAGFVYLHIMSTLLFSNAEFVEQGVKKVRKIASFSISAPTRKNEFTIRKSWLLKIFDNEQYLDKIFDSAKQIFDNAAIKYESQSGKTKISLFKNRAFDKDFLIPAINKYLENEKQ